MKNHQSVLDRWSRMAYTVVNIKLSLTTPCTSYENVKNNCNRLNIRYREFNNFIQCYDRGSLRYSFFKKKKQESATDTVDGFVIQCGNLTGLRSLLDLDSALIRIGNIINQDPKSIGYSIDNITANSVLHLPENLKRLNLRKLSKIFTKDHLKWHFNPERYSALILRLHGCTALIYSSANTVITGAKSMKQINEMHNSIYNSLVQLYPAILAQDVPTL